MLQIVIGTIAAAADAATPVLRARECRRHVDQKVDAPVPLLHRVEQRLGRRRRRGCLLRWSGRWCSADNGNAGTASDGADMGRCERYRPVMTGIVMRMV